MEPGLLISTHFRTLQIHREVLLRRTVPVDTLGYKEGTCREEASSKLPFLLTFKTIFMAIKWSHELEVNPCNYEYYF